MQWLAIKRWRGQLDNPKVIRQMRRKIRGAIEGGHCVMIDLDGVPGITSAQIHTLYCGWSEDKVRTAPPLLPRG